MARREWTKQEEAYLDKFYEKRGVGYLAKKLKRTEISVKRKAHSLGHNAYVCESLYVKTVAKCFNCDSRVVNRWIDKFGLPCDTVQRGQMTCRLIDGNTFWKWAYEHQDIILWGKYERFSILPEPDWVKEAISNYTKKNNRKKVSSVDVSTVVWRRKQGYTYKQIAKELGRGEDSVKHMYRKYKKEHGGMV